jgi:hypothetical protein
VAEKSFHALRVHILQSEQEAEAGRHYSSFALRSRWTVLSASNLSLRGHSPQCVIAGFEVNCVALRAAVHFRSAPILRHGLAYQKSANM